MLLLDQVLTRITVELQPAETLQWFKRDFAEELFAKLVAKVRDMYCCTSSVEILHKCFVVGCPAS
jgi:hypothetical protein